MVRSVVAVSFALLVVGCPPRKMEAYTPPPAQPMPTAASTAPPSTATPPPVPQLGPAVTPTGLVFPPEWNMPPIAVPRSEEHTSELQSQR